MKNAKVLSIAEMKKVIGGNVEIEEDEGEDSLGGTCSWHNGTAAFCNLSKKTAKEFQSAMGGNWCCSTCPPLDCL